MIENKPRAALHVSVEVSRESNGIIIPFAQQEMVYAFMEGIDQDLLNYLRFSTKSLFDAVFSTLVGEVEKLSKPLKSALLPLKARIDELQENLFRSWKEKQQEYWRPVVSNIASLPKDELAAMAEAFVNLTKFRRRATTERETVGGPIDVAVITRGDGFVWVRRKHYFDAQMNPRYMARFRGGTKE